MPYVTVRDEVKRHNYQETAFCNSLIPYYLQVDTKDKSERAKFFRAANILLFDRFPIETAGLTAVAARAAKSKAKRVWNIIGLFLRSNTWHGRVSQCGSWYRLFSLNAALFTLHQSIGPRV